MKITKDGGAMILGAGLGTRLRPLTEELPKPLVPVGDRSVLAHAARSLRQVGVTRVVINTHHLAEAFDRRALSRELDMDVALTVEPVVRGTAGGVAGAAELLPEGELLVHNGDILADADIAALLDEHRAHAPLCTLAVRPGLPAGLGPVGVDAKGWVVRLRSDRFGPEVAGAEFIGVAVLSAAARVMLPPFGCLVGDVYIPALARGARIRAAPVARWFSDVGTISEYLAANEAWLRRAGLSEYVAPGGRVPPTVSIAGSVIGAGGAVTGEGELSGCVVWPGATAVAPLVGAVVTPRGTTFPP